MNGTAGASATSPDLLFENLGSEVVAERSPAGTTLRRFVHGPASDEPLVHYEGSGTADRRFLQADERGSIVAVTDASGNPLAINTYDEYGNTATTSSTNMGPFLYTGQRYLGSLGLYHYKARMYHPKLGRFMQTDPIGYDDGMNLYAYVGGDPVNLSDPTGLCTEALRIEAARAGDILVCGDGGGGISPYAAASGPLMRASPDSGSGGRRATGRETPKLDYDPSVYRSKEVLVHRGEPLPCPTGYTQYSFGPNFTLAGLVGLALGAQLGISVPDDPTLRGTQFFASLQGAGMLGIGGFIGAGLSASFGRSEAPMPSVDGTGFAYGEANVGWGKSAGVSVQASESGGSLSLSAPVPKVGFGFGGYAGAGAGGSVTLATDPAGC